MRIKPVMFNGYRASVPRAARAAGLLCAVAWAFSARATDVAFWKPYAPDTNTLALFSFDGPEPLAGAGRLVGGAGRSAGGARLEAGGKFGGALRLDGSGYVSVPTRLFDPAAVWSHPVNRALSVEAWVRLERYPAADGKAYVVSRPHEKERTSGFALFVTADGALGLSVTGRDGQTAERRTPAGAVPLGEWAHVAGISSGGHLSVGRDALYVNGRRLFDGPDSGAGGSLPDLAATDLTVGGTPYGGGVAGLIDDVRVHARVARLWPCEPMPWLARIAAEGLPAPDQVLVPERQPWLSFLFDGDTRPTACPAMMASDPAIVERFKIDFQGTSVPGVKGQAINGTLKISGFRLADWREGSMEFWVRPRGVNNVSDANVPVVSASGLTAYFYNSAGPFKPLSFYYSDAERKLRMHSAKEEEMHPGRWYHLTFAWDAENIVLYVDGRQAASGGNAIGTGANRGVLDSLTFRPGFDVDELCFYERRLTSGEVANRYWSYVDPKRIVPAEPPAPILLSAWRHPGAAALHYRLSAMPGITCPQRATLRLADEAGKTVMAFEGRVDGQVRRIETPRLAEGVYALSADVAVGGKALKSAPVYFLAAGLPWEGNTLGVTNAVFEPFEPVATAGRDVSVVQRRYRMNGFGLWDSVLSQGRELLAAPIRLRCETADGAESVWAAGKAVPVSAAPDRAVYRAEAGCDAVSVVAVSEIEMDGMMRVTLTLAPGARPVPLKRLWLEIPVRASEASLMHEDTGSLRRNYSGAVPAGTGTVWRAQRKEAWRNAFAGYVWVGGEERGLAWFAENDKGWITEKGLSDRPLQEIAREPGAVVLRVNLVNVPGPVTETRELVFGLQASPAKPQPPDWRTGARGGGLPVTPWGGHQCADKFPFNDRWEVVDKIIESQLTGKDNGAWFREQQEKYKIPPVRGTGDWLADVAHFATWRRRPVLVYFEEMAAPTYRHDWLIYKDEWSHAPTRPQREAPEGYGGPRSRWPDGYDLFRQGRQVCANARVNFTASYRDYGAYYANEWLKRGVGIYWDNAYLTTCSDPLTSAAYVAEDGQIQPALTLWNQRDYSKRIWNLMHQWRRTRKEKLLFLQHMTNTSLLPILAWCTTAFDNEFSPRAYARGVGYPVRHDPKEPFAPEYLRAQSLGRQTGTYPVLCHRLFRLEDFAVDPALVPTREKDRPERLEDSAYAMKREWGMQKVHELPGGPDYNVTIARLNNALKSFGYDTARVQPHTYWAEKPALTTDRATLKWLLLARPADKRVLVVVQSWSRSPGEADLTFGASAIGFAPQGEVTDMETGERLGLVSGGAVRVALPTPYAFRMLCVGALRAAEGVLFNEAFEDGASLRWDYVSPYLQVPEEDGNGFLRFGKNSAPWMGAPRVELWSETAVGQDASLSLRVRVSAAAGKGPLLTLVTRADAPPFSRHGLSHTALQNGQHMELRADPEAKSLGLTRWTVGRDGKRSRAAGVKLGTLDGAWHTLALALKGPRCAVLFDGREAAVFEETPVSGNAFGIQGSRALSESLTCDIDDVKWTVPGTP
ncbi:MAG: DUF6067 family protein [Kiritimatiellia bacterium]|jgi:hypothetical protein|nr:DUF6067 family protein [Kiritimatiellia bacterium]